MQWGKVLVEASEALELANSHEPAYLAVVAEDQDVANSHETGYMGAIAED